MSTGPALPYSEHVSKADVLRIENLQQQNISTNKLFDLLGASVEGDAATGEDPDGEEIFNRQMLRIKKAICANSKITNFLESPQGGDTTNLIIVLSGALTAAKFFGIDVVAIAFLIARIGVRKMCESTDLE